MRKLKFFIAGMAAFGISQLLLRLPLLNLIKQTDTYIITSITAPVLILWGLAFTAGLFEETGRLVFLRLFRKQGICLSEAVTFGLGHGLMEAGWLAISILSFIFANGFTAMSAVAIFERVMAVTIHVALSIIVVMAVVKHQLLFYILAIAMHTFVDGLSFFFKTTFSLEAAIAAAAILYIILALLIWKLKMSGSKPGGRKNAHNS